MTDGQKPNKPLFSQHYLEHRLQECLEWQVDVTAGFEALTKLYQSKKALLPTLSEAQTEAVFIQPVLDLLGFSHIPQVTTRGKGRAERPDYALFTSEADQRFDSLNQRAAQVDLINQPCLLRGITRGAFNYGYLLICFLAGF